MSKTLEDLQYSILATNIAGNDLLLLRKVSSHADRKLSVDELTAYMQDNLDFSAGDQGPPGEDGSTWTSGSGEPSGGADGDFYLRTTNGDVYEKVAGVWTVVISGYELQANKDQPDGYAGLNEDGHIVGPIIISIYADAAEAEVLPDGTLASVGGKLHLGDGETEGGLPVAKGFDNVTAISGDSLTLDESLDGSLIYQTLDTFLISNQLVILNNGGLENELPVGYTIDIVATNGSGGSLDYTVELVELANVLYAGSISDAESRYVQLKKIANGVWVVVHNFTVNLMLPV